MCKSIRTYNNYMSNSTPQNWFELKNKTLKKLVYKRARFSLNLCVLREPYDSHTSINFIINQRKYIKSAMFYTYRNWRY